MITHPVVERYASALFATAKDAGALKNTLEELELLAALMRREPEAAQFLLNPDVDVDDKIGALDRALKSRWSIHVKTFVRLVVAMDRMAFFLDMVEAFSGLVDEHEGLLRATVRSAHPLTEERLNRLKRYLEHREQRQVTIATEVEPGLLGGVQVLLDHRVIDGSVRRQLDELKNRLKAIRVY